MISIPTRPDAPRSVKMLWRNRKPPTRLRSTQEPGSTFLSGQMRAPSRTQAPAISRVPLPSTASASMRVSCSMCTWEQSTAPLTWLRRPTHTLSQAMVRFSSQPLSRWLPSPITQPAPSTASSSTTASRPMRQGAASRALGEIRAPSSAQIPSRS